MSGYTGATSDATSKAGDLVLGDVAHVCCPDALTQLSPATRGLCNDWSYYQARYEKAIADAGQFTARSAWVTWVFAIAPTPPQGPPAPPACSEPVRISTAAVDSVGSTNGVGPTAASTPSVANPGASSTNSVASSNISDGSASPSGAAAASVVAVSGAQRTASATDDQDAQAKERPPASFNQEDVQSIGLVLSVCSTYVLPLFFGVLGTIAKFSRDIANKTSTYTLSPRDENLFFMRLLLGAIAGIAVGLFYSPTASAHQVVVGAGILTLSASSFSFLAGYAADVFFGFLDRVVTSVFKIIAPDTDSK